MDAQFKKQILSMNNDEWQKYRIDRWTKTRQYFLENKLPPPDFFLKTKEDYVSYLEAKTPKEKIDKLFNTSNESKEMSAFLKFIESSPSPTFEIESLDDKQWSKFRKAKWNQHIQNKENEVLKEAPATFLTDQKKYVKNLKTIESLESEKSILSIDQSEIEFKMVAIEDKINLLKEQNFNFSKSTSGTNSGESASKIWENYDKNERNKIHSNNTSLTTNLEEQTSNDKQQEQSMGESKK